MVDTPERNVPETRAREEEPVTVRVERGAVPEDLPAFVALLGDQRFEERYEAADLLGRGGMGEVRLYLDRRIGRDVAQKTLRQDVRRSPVSLERFVREARVQGQLEHPAVVPVYDLGVDPRGQVFFTMKRVRGTPLDGILDELAAGDAETRERYSRRKLLTAFVQVCLAIDFAHARGVLHRDLKPGNVMLGDYGEVHVLDWGLAKILGKRERRDGEVTGAAAPDERGSQDSGQTPTLAGSVLGTPGYMSPEQASGEVDGLDARTDVYALGAILFEIVYREELHPGPGVPARMASTIGGGELRASHRKHGAEVPPELEAICKKACALDPDFRYPSARALADAVERFLDGERDEERRKTLAEEHVAKARALTERADGGDASARTEALRELGRALVLDPTHETALRALEAMLSHVPATPPPEARAEVTRAENAQRRAVLLANAIRQAFWAVVAVTLYVTLPLRDASVAGVVVAGVVGLFALSTFAWRARPGSRPWWAALVVGTAAVIGLASMVFGPFVFVPSLAATYTVLLAPQTTPPERTFLQVSLALATLAPALLGEAGVIPRVHEFLPDGAMVIRSPIFAFEPHWTLVILLATNALVVFVPGILGGRFFDRLRALEARSIVQSWTLRQLLPKRG
jgi:serine/threonine-protein kinase